MCVQVLRVRIFDTAFAFIPADSAMSFTLAPRALRSLIAITSSSVKRVLGFSPWDGSCPRSGRPEHAFSVVTS